MELWTRNGREFCQKWRLPRHFWVLLRRGTDSFTSPPKEGALRIFSCFGTLDPSYCDSIHCINFFLFVLISASVPTNNHPNVKMESVVTVVSVFDNPDSVVQEQC